jgi:hypothetical protein
MKIKLIKNIIGILFFFTITLILFNSCKKEPTTGTIKIQFSGTPSADVGQKATISFAIDLYHLNQKIYEMSKVSNNPHQEIIISDVKPQTWYYLVSKSTPGIPIETQGTVNLEAGKTEVVSVNF